MKLITLFRRLYFHVAFHFYVKHKLTQTDVVSMNGLTLKVPPTVFHPLLFRSSAIFADHLQMLDCSSKHVLDIGCGSGLLSLVAASKGAQVTSLDINHDAIVATEENAKANNLHHLITTIENDGLYNLNFTQKFDYIIMNPPFYMGTPTTVADRAWKGGQDYDYLQIIAHQARNTLKQDGVFIFIISTDAEVKRIEKIFLNECFNLIPVSARKLLFETFTIYHAKLSSQS
ncbi:MAG TPA: class I SAM-dependent methyltransferase [Bacteroidota bacterium]|nr:class I SAM-dependent methyltransferase [Bacteroidota bacterium]